MSHLFMGMSPNTPSSPGPVPPPSTPLSAKKSRWLLYGCGTLLALLLMIAASVAITLWWIQRPIKPVVLSAQERATVDEKLRPLGGGNSSNLAPGTAAAAGGSAKPGARPQLPGSGTEPNVGQDRRY